MHVWQVITTIVVIGVLVFSSWFVYKEIKSRRKIPYQKLFGKRPKEYLVRSNKFIAWLVLIFFISVFSIGYCYRITVISLPVFLIILSLLTAANIYFLKKKYKIKENTDVAFLSIVIGMGQLSLLFWINFIPIGKHSEAYQIVKYESDSYTNLTTIYLKDDAFKQNWTLRSFETNHAPTGDTVIYHFNEGLAGFRIYTGHSSH